MEGGYKRSSFTVRVSDHPDDPGNDLDVLHLEIGNVRILAEGEHHAAAVASAVFQSTVPIDEHVHVFMHSPAVAAAVEVGLQSHRNHNFKGFNLVFAHRRVLGTFDDDACTEPQPTLDGNLLCSAALLCPAVSSLVLDGFEFSGLALSLASECRNNVAAASPLNLLALCKCTSPSPLFGFASLLTSVVRGSALEMLDLLGTELKMRDMTFLCRCLVESNWALAVLKLGGFPNGGAPSLGDACVEYFYKSCRS